MGHFYHHIFPTKHPLHPINWFLYDPLAGSQQILHSQISPSIMQAVHSDLEVHNPLLHCFYEFANFHMAEEDVTMEILDPSTSNEIAAVFHIDGGAQHEA